MSSTLRPEPSPQDCVEILDFLEGRLETEALDRFVARLSAEPELLEAVEEFAAMDRLQRMAVALGSTTERATPRSIRPSPRVLAFASAAAAVLLMVLGVTLWRALRPDPAVSFQVAAAGSREELFSTLRSPEPAEAWYVGIQAEGPGYLRLFSLDDAGSAHALDLGAGRRSEPVSGVKVLSFGPYPRSWTVAGATRSHAAFIALVTPRELDEDTVDTALSGAGGVNEPEGMAALLARELSGSARVIPLTR